MITAQNENPHKNPMIKQGSNHVEKPMEWPNEDQILSLPFGLIGFPKMNEIEIVYSKEELPFLRMRQVKSEDKLEFLILEPYGLFPDYKVEISAEDIERLEIKSEKDVYLLNIVTVSSTDSQNTKITVNLVAPIVFNKKTLAGKQVIITNYKEYSSSHLLFSGHPDTKEEPRTSKEG